MRKKTTKVYFTFGFDMSQSQIDSFLSDFKLLLSHWPMFELSYTMQTPDGKSATVCLKIQKKFKIVFNSYVFGVIDTYRELKDLSESSVKFQITTED